MDPNEALRLLRLTIKQMRVDEDPGVRAAHAAEIAEYAEALDEWLSKGGFMPADWRGESDYSCAECGTTDATTFVVTFTEGSRTEVCRACDDQLRVESGPLRHTHEFMGQSLVHSHPHDEPHGYFEHPEDAGAPRMKVSVEVYFEMDASNEDEAFERVHSFLRKRERDIRYAGMHYELLEGAASEIDEHGRVE